MPAATGTRGSIAKCDAIGLVRHHHGSPAGVMSTGKWPGRAEATHKFVAGKLTFAGLLRPILRARRERQQLAEASRKVVIDERSAPRHASPN